MNPNEYQQLAIRTESPFAIPIGTQTHRLLHSGIGCATEAGELLDGLKRHAFYNKPLDITNLLEEYGDLLWYIALGIDACGATMEQVMQANIDKLRARYPEKFTEEAATNRDLDKEREVLESSGGRELNITLSGPAMTGKTLVMREIANHLMSLQFDVSIAEEGGSPRSLDSYYGSFANWERGRKVVIRTTGHDVPGLVKAQESLAT